MRKVFFLFTLILLFQYAYSSKVEIKGTAKEYANSEIVFYKYTDRISFLKEKIFTILLDSIGNFHTVFELNSTQYVFAEFGIYHAYFYAEPNSTYEIILPEYIEKKEKDIFNPFFEPYYIHLGIKNMSENDLNYLILDFDYYYNRYVDLNLLKLYANGLKTDVDTFITEIHKRYKNTKLSFFSDYLNYRIANLKNIVTQKKYESLLVKTYFTKKPVLYDNPAYMDLFNNVFSDYFDSKLMLPEGANIYAIINYGHSIKRLKQQLYQKEELRSPQFCELVILKSISDAFANRNFAWFPLLLTLDSLHLSTKYPLHQVIAQNIADNSLTMAVGTIAPQFELLDMNNKTYKLQNYHGKYLYLQFANTKTITSKSEFNLVKNLYERYGKYCNFVTILTDDDLENAKKFIVKNKFSWTFLFTTANSQVISDYNVVNYPSYYLINENAELIMSPAPSPSENFEHYFFKLIDDKK